MTGPRRLVVTLDGETLFEQEGAIEVTGTSNIDGQMSLQATFPPTPRGQTLSWPTRSAIDSALKGLPGISANLGNMLGNLTPVSANSTIIKSSMGQIAAGLAALQADRPKRPWWKFWAKR